MHAYFTQASVSTHAHKRARTCIYAHARARPHTQTHTHTHICTHVHTHTHTGRHTHTHRGRAWAWSCVLMLCMSLCVYMCVCLSLSLYIYIYLSVCACMFARACPCIHSCEYGACATMSIIAQCSTTPASVVATPPVARHFFRGSLTCDTPGSWRATNATGFFGGGIARYLCYTWQTPEFWGNLLRHV